MIISLILYFFGAACLGLTFCSIAFAVSDKDENEAPTEVMLIGVIGALLVVAARMG